MITRMFGRGGRRLEAVRCGGTGASAGGGACAAPDPSSASASLEIARPPPRIAPPAIRPFVMNVRLSTPCAAFLSILLSSSALMVCIRVSIVGSAVLLALSLTAASARAATYAPACAPSTLNTSAQLDGSVTVSPLPGSRDATPQTQISFLGVPASELSDVTVTGSDTGPHSGRLAAYSQGDGASFLPAHPFAEGETVTVRAQLRSAGAVQQLSDQF